MLSDIYGIFGATTIVHTEEFTFQRWRMNKPERPSELPSRGDNLFKAQREIDTLIRRYVCELVESRDAYATQVSMLQGIFDSMSNAMVVYDRNGKVLLVNKRATAIIGRDPTYWSRNYIDNQLKLFKTDGCTPFPPDERPYVLASKGLRSSAEGIVYGENFPPEGRSLKMSAAPIRNAQGEVVGVVGTFDDITDLRRFERQRNAFAALIAHDIKNHLAAEDMTLELLASELQGTVDPSLMKMILDIKLSNERFLHIASTFLELYRADLYAMESARAIIEPAKILQASIALNALHAKNVGVTIRLHAPDNLPRVQGIPAALIQSFHNIIQNSLEASKPGTTIEVTVSSTSSVLTVTITDHGSGMPEDIVAGLFDRTRAASCISTTTTSTGFGLYLSSMIVEAHEGRIYCQSRVGSGTTFTIELPVSAHQN